MIKRYYDLIILGIIWLVSIISVITAIYFSYNLGLKVYIGYGLLILLSILRYISIKRYYIFLIVLLILAMYNIIQFSQFFWSNNPVLAINGHELSIGEFQTLYFILLIFIVIVNISPVLRKLKYLIFDLFSGDQNVKINRQEILIDKYYKELQLEKDSKLNEIIENKNMFQNEYVSAAQRLIEERKIK